MANCEVIVQGLKCDADGCDHEDMSINSEDYSEYVNAPCPRCGAPLLTPEDFESFKALVELSEMLNQLPAPEDQTMVNGKVIMDGSGKLELEF